MKSFFFSRILPVLLWSIIHIWCRTLRVQNRYPENDPVLNSRPGKYILALWHGRIFYLFYYFRNRNDLYILVSPSRDGDFLAKLGRLMGYSVVRGSSFKKAVPAARSLIKILRKDQQVAIVADGSRGPRQKVQPGSLQLAARTGAEVIPMGFDAQFKIELNSWDRFLLPLPFSRCFLSFGKPIKVSREASQSFIKTKQNELEATLNNLSLR